MSFRESTTILQSKELLALGIPEETADKCWFFPPDTDVDDNGEMGLLHDKPISSQEPPASLPSWSLSALLYVLPGYIDCESSDGEKSCCRLVLLYKDYKVWECGYLEDLSGVLLFSKAEQPIDAVFGLIKKAAAAGCDFKKLLDTGDSESFVSANSLRDM